MERAMLEAMGVPPEAAEAVLAMAEAEQTALPPMLIGLPALDPPLSGVPARSALAQMSCEEINRSWSAVKEVLGS